MSRPVTAFEGESLYLDTTALYALLRAVNTKAADLFTQIETGRFDAYTSALTFDELAYRLLLALIRDNLPGSPLDQLRYNETTLVARYFPQIADSLDKLLSFPHLTVLAIDRLDVLAMNQIVLSHQLRPRDALHLASMRRCGCTAIVSEDRHFDLVEDIDRLTLE